MENKYQITGYQLVYANGGRDTVKLQTPVIISDIEGYRRKIRSVHNCIQCQPQLYRTAVRFYRNVPTINPEYHVKRGSIENRPE